MTLRTGTRRGFLASAVALLAMPAVVRADGLMKVAPTYVILPECLFDRRVLIDYQIESDSLVMRVDVLRGKLNRPPDVREATLEDAVRVFGVDHPIFSIQPIVGVQRVAMTTVGHRAYNNGVGYTHWMAPFSDPEHAHVSTVGGGWV